MLFKKPEKSLKAILRCKKMAEEDPCRGKCVESNETQRFNIETLRFISATIQQSDVSKMKYPRQVNYDSLRCQRKHVFRCSEYACLHLSDTSPSYATRWFG
jgi:hypothetical protein